MDDEFRVTTAGGLILLVVGDLGALSLDPGTAIDVAKKMLDQAELLLNRKPGNGEDLEASE